MNEIVSLEALNKNFGELLVLQEIFLSVSQGQIFGLIGPDGSGKTTILRILAGILSFEAQKAAVLGFDLKKETEKIKPRIGYMSQSFGLYPELTVEENLDFFSDLYNVKPEIREERKKQLLEFSRLEKFKKRQARHLSGGMYKKLALGCTLIHEPELLLLDEPTTGVDPVSRREFWKIIENLRGKTTILVTTHYMDEAEKCDQLGLLYQGRLIESDTPKNLKEKFPQKIYSLKCAFPFELQKNLKTLPEIEEVNLFGNRLHFILKNPADFFKVKDKLVNFQCELGNIEEMAPRLEDVFVFLIKK